MILKLFEMMMFVKNLQNEKNPLYLLKKPLITMGLATHYQEKFIKKMFNFIIQNQTYKNQKLLPSNDNSNDKYQEICKSICKKYYVKILKLYHLKYPFCAKKYC